MMLFVLLGPLQCYLFYQNRYNVICITRTIMQLTNELVYDGALQCGSTDIAHKVVEFPQIEQLKVSIKFCDMIQFV